MSHKHSINHYKLLTDHELQTLYYYLHNPQFVAKLIIGLSKYLIESLDNDKQTYIQFK